MIFIEKACVPKDRSKIAFRTSLQFFLCLVSGEYNHLLRCRIIGTMTLVGLSGYFYHQVQFNPTHNFYNSFCVLQSQKVTPALKTQRYWLQFCSAGFLLAGIARAKPSDSKATDLNDVAD